jgi:hypothetical protein
VQNRVTRLFFLEPSRTFRCLVPSPDRSDRRHDGSRGGAGRRDSRVQKTRCRIKSQGVYDIYYKNSSNIIFHFFSPLNCTIPMAISTIIADFYYNFLLFCVRGHIASIAYLQ